jgi:hypothetical protein
VPPPLLLLFVGAMLLAIGLVMRHEATRVPDGWITTDAVIVRAYNGTRISTQYLAWTATGGAPLSGRCHLCPGEVGDLTPIAYDPDDPSELKSMDSYRYTMPATLGLGAFLLVAAVVVAVWLPPRRPFLPGRGTWSSPASPERA